MQEPTTTLDVLGERGKCPEKAIGDYLISRKLNNLLIKPPNWDSCGDGIELLALQNDREHKRMLLSQEELLHHSEVQTIINENRTFFLFQIMSQLKKGFIKTNSFLKDCEDKKIFAEAKVREEKSIHAGLKEDIKKYKDGIKELVEFREQLKNTVEEFEPYERVTNEVLNDYKRFSSLKDCTERCDALMMAHVEIVNMKRQKLQEIIDLTANMVKLTTEASMTVMGLSNQLAELQRGYNAATVRCLKWEKILRNVKDYLAESDLTKQRQIDGIRVMYNILCSRRKLTPVIPKEDVAGQMDFIKNEIEIIQAVITECMTKKKK